MCSLYYYLLISVIFLLDTAAVFGAQKDENQGCRIFFTRAFPGSVPEYFEIEVEMSGKVFYREDPTDEPLIFELSAENLSWLTTQVKNLDYFRISLTHPRKVAFTGRKFFRYIDSTGNQSETEFIYTENPDAKALASWFLRAGETARHRIELERAMRFDRLGVNKRLIAFQISLDKDRVISPKQMLPILIKISNNKKIIHLSRSRAEALVQKIERESSKK